MSHRSIRDYLEFCVLRENMTLDDPDVDIWDTSGNTPLHLAVIRLKYIDITTKLIDKGVDIHARNYHDCTPLDLAIHYNKINAAILLIKRGALVGEDVSSLLLTAIKKNNDRIVKAIVDYEMQDNPSMNLLIHLKAAISRVNPLIIDTVIPHCGFSQLSDLYIPNDLVIETDVRSKECVRLLLKWNFTIHPDSHYDKDFIYGAVENGYLPIVVQLLEHIIDVNMVNSNTGLNLLTIACLNKHREIVELLLEHNADVNVKISGKNKRLNSQGCFSNNMYVFNRLLSSDGHSNDQIDVTCLHVAVFNSDFIITDILLKHGATTSSDGEFFYLTCTAIENSCKEIVRTFLDHGVKITDVNLQEKTLLNFCLDYYVSQQDSSFKIRSEFQLEIFEVLLHYNADVNHPDKNMLTPLHVASCGKNLQIIKVLLKKGVNPNARNDKGQTPLHLACEVMNKNILNVIQLLLKHGANIDAVDVRGWTPLFIAFKNNNYGAVKCLLDHHANPNHIDSENLTLLHIAIQQIPETSDIDLNHYRLIQLLIKNGARVDVPDRTNRTSLCYAIGKVIHHSSPRLHSLHYGMYKMIKILLSQGIKLRTAGLKVNNQNSNAVFNPDQYITIDHVRYLANDILQFNVIPYHNEVANRNAEEFDDEDLSDESSDDESANEESTNEEPTVDDFSDEEVFIGDIRQLRVRCKQEIKRMKITRIGIDDLTLHDLLKKNIRFLSILVQNDKIQQILKKKVYDKKFPLYKNIIKSRLRDATICHEQYMLRIRVGKWFRLKIDHRLPDECLDEIMIYLNIGELKIFIEAMKRLNY